MDMADKRATRQLQDNKSAEATCNKHKALINNKSHSDYTKTKLSCMYTNIDSLLNKRIELNALVNYHKPDIIALTEIKPKRCRYSIEPCEIEIDGYDLFHNLNSPGRGVAIYTTKSIKASSCVLFNNNDFSEALFVECNLNSADRLLVGAFYRSPNSDEINNNNMNDLFTSIGNSHYTHLLLLGDFNYREINWADEVCNTTPAHPAYKFLQCTKDLFYTKSVNLYKISRRSGRQCTRLNIHQ